MAKIVIAGQANCPYFARAELLGDKLAVNLPDFKLHKIVKTPEEWQDWLLQECQIRGWRHERSPLVYRELIDRGGKGILIGGANEFQEYANGYYGIQSELLSNDMKNIASENKSIKLEVDQDEADYKALSDPIHVCITHASSNVCYAMLNSICKGEILGENVEVVVHLLDDIEKKAALEGIKMEAEDLACGLLRDVKVETNVKDAFRNCSAIVFLDEIALSDKSKDDWIKENATLFTNYALVINEVALKSVKVLVAGSGPVNFNASIMIRNAPSIPRQNFVAMSRMVENYSKSVLAEKLKVNTADVVDVIVWGNPNGEYFIDVSNSRVHGYDGAIVGPDFFSVSVNEMVFDKKWLEAEFIELVKTKKLRSEEAMKHHVAFSVASAVNSTLNHWFNGSPQGQMFSLGICSEGWYGVPNDLVFSYPVTFHPKGYWNVVQDVELPEATKAIIMLTIKDLESELEVLFPQPQPPAASTEVNTNDNTSIDSGENTDDAHEGEPRLETIVEEKKENSEDDVEPNITALVKSETEVEADDAAGLDTGGEAAAEQKISAEGVLETHVIELKEDQMPSVL